MAEVKAKVTKVMKLYFSQNNREPSKNITLCKYFLSKNPKIWVTVQNTVSIKSQFADFEGLGKASKAVKSCQIEKQAFG